ncbi:probable carboxylesterase 5 [Lactuca sativa]|uniref:Alpha/beta hydrolase fold-3 domain-containing protein n=1 Tax=Lactuca sativa TaxID=4236 RepID=A0A9R1VC95_LACSA|nr:probable carboxylesterase 5 [Lactuca sativa]KAJ0202323.1 hypothetical protein LSAT_V11C600303610 [Lactuca sativa]
MKELLGILRVFEDGRYERIEVHTIVPAGIDPSTGVNSKDAVYSRETNKSARLYLPKTATPNHKLPLLIFYHGGGFVDESPFDTTYNDFLNLVVADSNVIAVSVDYRLAPEFPVPIAHEDSWEAIKWVAQHANGKGPEPWLNEYADLQNIFLAGDSAGGNLTHNMAVRVGLDTPAGLRFRGAILLHPYFWGTERVGTEADWMSPGLIDSVNELLALAYPGRSGMDDPLINPAMDPRIAGILCSKILLCVSGNDFMRDRTRNYKTLIENCGWKGNVEVVEDNEESHVFFLKKPTSKNAVTLRNRISAFINSA